jgi:hypothetical protein
VKKYGSPDKLKKKYECRDCRKIVKVKKARDKFTIEDLMTKTDEFKSLKTKLRAHVKNAKIMGIDNADNMKRFRLHVQTTMAEYNIHHYEFNIVNKDLRSIIITKVPFTSNIEIKLAD